MKVTIELRLEQSGLAHTVCPVHGSVTDYWRIYVGSNPNPICFHPYWGCIPHDVAVLLSQFPEVVEKLKGE